MVLTASRGGQYSMTKVLYYSISILYNCSGIHQKYLFLKIFFFNLEHDGCKSKDSVIHNKFKKSDGAKNKKKMH